MQGKCPFGKIKCVECVLYRKGLRYFDDNRKPEPFEECAITIGIDCLENLVGRSIGQQRATESARNEMAAMKELFYALAQKKAIEDLKWRNEPKQADVIDVTEVTE